MIQRDILLGLIKRVDGIEIGTLAGDTLNHLLENNPDLHMITIDPACEMTRVQTILDKYKERSRLIPKRSDDALEDLKGMKFDFIWVDGDHGYDQVKRDISNYMPLVKPGGFFGGHDYGSPSYPGIAQAVGELETTGYKIFLEDDGVWWVNV